MNKEKKLKKIPKFKTWEEEAYFWDNVDITDYVDFDNSNDMGALPSFSNFYRLTLPWDLKESLDNIANTYNMTIEELLKMWVGNYVKEGEDDLYEVK